MSGTALLIGDDLQEYKKNKKIAKKGPQEPETSHLELVSIFL